MAGRFTVGVHLMVTQDQWDKMQEKVQEKNVNLSILIREYIDEGLALDKLNRKLVNAILRETRERYENEQGR